MEKAYLTPKEGLWCNCFQVVLPQTFLMHQLGTSRTTISCPAASPGQPLHQGSLWHSPVPGHYPQPSSFCKGWRPPWQYGTHFPQLSPAQAARTTYWLVGQHKSINKHSGNTYRAEVCVFHNINQ